MNTDILYVFHHIPKTGGTTLGACINQAFPGTSKHLEGSHEIPYIPNHIKIVYGHCMWGAHLYRPVQYFTLLRNPFDIALSTWHHLRKWDRDNLGKEKRMPHSFERFIELGNGPPQSRFSRLAGELSGNPAIVQCYHLAMAQNILKNQFVIGFTDSFDAALATFNRHFEWGLRKMPKMNANPYIRNFPSRAKRQMRFNKLNIWDFRLYEQMRKQCNDNLDFNSP